MPGPPKQYETDIRVQMSHMQKRHLEFRALADGCTISDVVRTLIEEDQHQVKEEEATRIGQ